MCQESRIERCHLNFRNSGIIRTLTSIRRWLKKRRGRGCRVLIPTTKRLSTLKSKNSIHYNCMMYQRSPQSDTPRVTFRYSRSLDKSNFAVNLSKILEQSIHSHASNYRTDLASAPNMTSFRTKFRSNPLSSSSLQNTNPIKTRLKKRVAKE